MNNLSKLFTNNRGITLVELLATIVLLSIIGALSSSLLFQGYSNYQRIQVESELRDEADIIMASFIKEVFLLKNSEVTAFSNCSTGKATSYIGAAVDAKETPSEYFTGFENNHLVIKGEKIQFHNKNISLIPPTCSDENSPTLISESDDGKEIKIIFTLRAIKGNTEHNLKFENSLQVISNSGGDS